MDLVIQRSKWLRGDDGKSDSSLLRSSDGKMCCLGFLSLACGLTKSQIKDKPAPSELFASLDEVPEEMRWLLKNDNHGRDSDEGNTLMSVNDTYNGRANNWIAGQSLAGRIKVEGDADRERIITETMAKHGIQVTFVD